jgi:N6-adenosine-specific RNA methylase IME4
LKGLSAMKFDVILADCPWSYRDDKGKNPAMGGITYPVMSDEDIYNLPVSEIANKDSLLFLWATLPKLPEALHTMESWGFKYTTTPFVWVKLNPTGTVAQIAKDVILRGGVYSGLGHWTNGNIEIVLMGKRGTPKRKNKNVKQIIFAPRSRHSAKPKEIYTRIENLVISQSNIELFARQRKDGWYSLGNEITGNDIAGDLKTLAVT